MTSPTICETRPTHPAGSRVSLQELPFRVLARLTECPGRLVTRGQLREELWPRDTFVDFEHGLNAAVKRLRDALGDSAETPRFIETLPRRGYRFIAPVAPFTGRRALVGSGERSDEGQPQ
jgi:DNA-binding winged helix-turn-helix (wHTH) protein